MIRSYQDLSHLACQSVGLLNGEFSFVGEGDFGEAVGGEGGGEV